MGTGKVEEGEMGRKRVEERKGVAKGKVVGGREMVGKSSEGKSIGDMNWE